MISRFLLCGLLFLLAACPFGRVDARVRALRAFPAPASRYAGYESAQVEEPDTLRTPDRSRAPMSLQRDSAIAIPWHRGGFRESPTGVLLRSVAFPGWGQWSNGKKQKAAVFFSVETYFAAKALVWRHRARKSGIDFETFDHARDRRNYFYWLTGLTVFVSMFDAYADRYLLTLERTRDAGDEYWGVRGGNSPLSLSPPATWRLSLRLRF